MHKPVQTNIIHDQNLNKTTYITHTHTRTHTRTHTHAHTHTCTHTHMHTHTQNAQKQKQKTKPKGKTLFLKTERLQYHFELRNASTVCNGKLNTRL